MPVSLLGLGAAAAGAGSLMAGIGGMSSAKKSAKEAKRQFNIQMNESIQRRVADAREAGIHPLFALGASVGASPTIHAGGSSTGSALGEGLAEAGRAVQSYAKGKTTAALASAQIRSAEAQATRDEAEAQLSLSRAKRIEQDLVSRGHDGIMGAKTFALGEAPYYGPAEFVAPQIPLSRRKGMEAGIGPGHKEIVVPDGRRISVLTEGLQADEINQIEYLRQRAIHRGTDAFVWLHNKLADLGIAKWRIGK